MKSKWLYTVCPASFTEEKTEIVYKLEENKTKC